MSFRPRGKAYVEVINREVDNMKAGLIHNLDGEYAVICTEGVSWQVGDGFKFNDYDPNEVPSTVEDLKAMRTGEDVDLADFIRTFGARLERNFAANLDWMDNRANPMEA